MFVLIVAACVACYMSGLLLGIVIGSYVGRFYMEGRAGKKAESLRKIKPLPEVESAGRFGSQTSYGLSTPSEKNEQSSH